MEEVGFEVVKKRAVSGVVLLTTRTFVLNVASFIAQGFLWAFLAPSEFGVFWIVSAVVNFLAYFGDIGLAAALIQKKEKPDDTDLKTTFTIQQGLVFVLLVILVIAAPFLAKTYSLTPEGTFLLYALGISFLLSSLKSIPSVLLERELEFTKLVIPQVLENLVYNLSVVFFAWKGFGIASFSYSVLLRGLTGLVLIYLIKPWRPGFAFSFSSLKDLLRFGLPYQLNSFLAVLKDDGMTAILGGILGANGLGILGTARRLAQYPLRFFMDNVTKVTFPAFARLQGGSADLKRALERSIFFITFLVFPTIVGLVVLAPILVRVIPRYEKWIPALVPLAILSIDTLFAGVTTQLTNFLNATGRIKTTFIFMIMWTALTFILVPFLAIRGGPTGAAIGYALVGVSSIVVIVVVKRLVNFSISQSVAKPLFASLLMALTLLILRNFLPTNFYSLWILSITGGIVYGVTILLLVGVSLIEDVKKTFATIFSRR